MNEESRKLSAAVRRAERPFAKKGFELRLSEVYPSIDESQRQAISEILADQVFKKSSRTKEDFVAAITAAGLSENDYPVLDDMLGKMTAALVGLGSDILEQGPEAIHWS